MIHSTTTGRNTHMKSIITTLRNSVLTLSAAGTAAQLHAEAAAAPAANPLGSFLPLIVIFVIFYFLLIRPQQKRAKEHQRMLTALKKDDKIVSTGGIYGTITSVKGDVLEVKIAENVKVQMSRSAVSALVPPENQAVTPEVVK